MYFSQNCYHSMHLTVEFPFIRSCVSVLIMSAHFAVNMSNTGTRNTLNNQNYVISDELEKNYCSCYF